MKNISKKLSALLAVLLTCIFAFSACGFVMNESNNNSSKSESSKRSSSKKDADDEDDDTEENMVLKAVSPLDGKMVSLVNDEVAEFLENYDLGHSAEYATGADHFAMKGLDLKWETEDSAEEYEVALSSLDEELEAATVYTAEKAKLHVDDLFVNKQY